MEPRLVKDLMLPLEEYATIYCERTIKDALEALDKAQMGLTYDRHHHRAILALDEEGNVVGKVTHHSILRCLEPRLITCTDLEALERANLDENFIQGIMADNERRQQSLASMCANAGRMRVADAMIPTRESVEEESPLSEAIHLLVETHVQSMLVTREGRVTGILRLSDVFEEVADMIRQTSC